MLRFGLYLQIQKMLNLKIILALVALTLYSIYSILNSQQYSIYTEILVMNKLEVDDEFSVNKPLIEDTDAYI